MSSHNTDDVLTEVPVQAAVLQATASLLELLGDFFTDADPRTLARLGNYLISRYGEENTTDTVTEVLVILSELNEAAELLHALAGDYNSAQPDQR